MLRRGALLLGRAARLLGLALERARQVKKACARVPRRGGGGGWGVPYKQYKQAVQPRAARLAKAVRYTSCACVCMRVCARVCVRVHVCVSVCGLQQGGCTCVGGLASVLAIPSNMWPRGLFSHTTSADAV